MKRESARANVEFRMTFTQLEVTALSLAAHAHYDAACRACEPLRRLAAYIKWNETRKDNIPLTVVLTWRDFDILSKICESGLVPQAIASDVWATFTELRDMTESANSVIGED